MMGVAKRTAESLFERLGYVVVPKWRLPRLPMAVRLRRLFAEHNISCVLDVGANIGQYGRFLRNEVGFSGPIVSFEPNSQVLPALRRTAATATPWRIEALALGERDCEAAFNIMAGDEFSSFLEPDTTSGYRADLNAVVAQESVRMQRLDTWAQTHCIDLPLERVYLKLDTQGYDLSVIAGATGFLGHIVAMQSEIPFKKLYKDSPDASAHLARYRELGFEPAEMFSNNHAPDGRAIEFDCVMVNTRGLG
jgi:FkbM family methyltransferase